MEVAGSSGVLSSAGYLEAIAVCVHTNTELPFKDEVRPNPIPSSNPGPFLSRY